jgi:hypothetical protein
MSNEFNIRDFRRAGAAPETGASKKSNRGFYICVFAIPVFAAMAGLSYKPLMALRGQNVAAVPQADADMEAKRRAENPLYALRQDMKNSDGLIDSNKMFGTRAPTSEAQKMRNEYARRGLNAREFLNRVDAKVSGFSPLEMEVLKFERAAWAMTTCEHRDLRAFYIRQNKPLYERLKAKQNTRLQASRDARAAKMEKLDLPKVENKTQALAFVATGGAARHQANAMNMMAGLSSLTADSGKHKVKSRRQRFGKRGCSNVRTIVQSGVMRVKPVK